jgi:DNA polymerase-3 subunit delta'
MTVLEAAAADHAQARVMLTTALAHGPSHAYLFFGPRGVGKADVARAFAAELLAEGSADPDGARGRALRGSHQDLTWVSPSGAHEMRVSDIDQSIVRGATLTPMEGARRVFVIERAETMSSDVANRLLKTLEEPAPYASFILLTSAPERVLPTVISRCQAVRFDAVPVSRIASVLIDEGVEPVRAASCAALSGGDGHLAAELASSEGDQMRSEAGKIVGSALNASSGRERPWEALLARATEAGAAAASLVEAETEERVEPFPKGREKTKALKEGEEAAKRTARRVRTDKLEQSLRIAALLFRDIAAAAAGEDELVLAQDRMDSIERASAGRAVGPLLDAAAEIEETRLMLSRNVAEELMLQAMSFKLDGLLARR